MQAALREGKCAVIGLQTTGEAAEASLEMSPGMRVDAFVSTTREMLLGFIRTHFPVYIEDVAAASDANGGHPDGQSLLNPGLNPGTPLGPIEGTPRLRGGPKDPSGTGRPTRPTAKLPRRAHRPTRRTAAGRRDDWPPRKNRPRLEK